MSENGKVIVKMNNIYKSFPGVRALQGVDFTIRRGEVHGLVGENGAGKSTLIKILMGVYDNFDSGEIYIEDKKVEIKNPIQARRYGLAAVYQDVHLANNLTVAENFFLGKIPRKKMGIVDWSKMHRVAGEVLKELDVNIDPGIQVKNLSTAEQAMILIAKIIHQESRVIIFDEPTALITKEETEEIFKLINKLKEKDIGIIYISHRLEEIFAICDIVTVLKDGMEVKTIPVADTNKESIISMMVGRKIGSTYFLQDRKIGKKILEVKNLSKGNEFKDISFELSEGEALGFYGLIGSGMAGIAKSIFGGINYDSGEILINGKKVSIKSPIDGIKHKISFLPEDRKKEGLALILDVATNINLASYASISRAGFINTVKERNNAQRYTDALNIKTPSLKQKVINLSGGNQQKVVFAKWLCGNSRIFIFDEPTVGVDVGAKFEIYKIIEEILNEGNLVIIVSTYLPEIIGITDRTMVFYEGQNMGCLSKSEYDEEKLLNMASG
ncbi:MAG: sugar ABC transporter ATP-binding protein, partial [Actinobacteria bacterium]|nr:sugar ABC transporter ATP-binding protein [Actinomycetota bacterium]